MRKFNFLFMLVWMGLLMIQVKTSDDYLLKKKSEIDNDDIGKIEDEIETETNEPIVTYSTERMKKLKLEEEEQKIQIVGVFSGRVVWFEKFAAGVFVWNLQTDTLVYYLPIKAEFVQVNPDEKMMIILGPNVDIKMEIEFDDDDLGKIEDKIETEKANTELMKNLNLLQKEQKIRIAGVYSGRVVWWDKLDAGVYVWNLRTATMPYFLPIKAQLVKVSGAEKYLIIITTETPDEKTSIQVYSFETGEFIK